MLERCWPRFLACLSKTGTWSVASIGPPGTSGPSRETKSGGLYVPAVGCTLRVTGTAWDALAVPIDQRTLPAPRARSDRARSAAPTDDYVRQFLSKCGQAGALGTVAKALRGIEPGLYRVSVGAEPRAVLWHDQQGGVIWLCAGLSFPDGDLQHKKLYAEVRRLHANGLLLPTDTEIKAARAERWWCGTVDELAYGLRRAEQDPHNWFDVEVTNVDGETRPYARFFVEEHQFSGEGIILERYFIVLREPPADVPHPPYWKEAMLAELFPEGGPIEQVYKHELPYGANLSGDEIILLHEVAFDEDRNWVA